MKAAEELHELATELHGKGAAVSFDREREAPRNGQLADLVWVVRVWDAHGECVRKMADWSKEKATRLMLSDLRAALRQRETAPPRDGAP